MNRADDVASQNADFSLILGGPLYRFFLRTRLARPPIAGVSRRVLACIFVTWAPLLVLSAMSGTFAGGVKVPFLYDIDLHVRFLVSMPLLLEAELIVHNRIRAILNQFLDSGLIAQEEKGTFAEIEASAMRLRNSSLAEIVLVLIAFVGGYWIWSELATLGTGTWYAAGEGNGSRLTIAGWWYAFVSLPIIRFLLLRWYFRILIWYRVMYRISRLKLQINPLHPDRTGGLSFLGASFDAFSLLLVAQSAFIAGMIGNKIWHEQAQLIDFKVEIAATTVLLLLTALLPLFFFLPALAKAKREGLPPIRSLAARYAREFQQKWCNPASGTDAALLGSADIQSLADFEASYGVASGMGLLPFHKAQIVRGMIIILLPFSPLLLTVVPFEELLERLVHLIL